MKILNLIAGLAILFLFISCGNNNKIELITPIGQYEGRIDTIIYEWSDEDATVFDLSISQSADFGEMTLDTSISGFQFISTELVGETEKYHPNTTYHWKINNGEDEKTGEFLTTNPLEGLTGEYAVETREWRFGFPMMADTTIFYNENLILTEVGQSIRVQFGNGEIDRVHDYREYSNGRFLYYYDLLGDSSGSYFYIDTSNREIEISSRDGSMLTGYNYSTTINY